MITSFGTANKKQIRELEEKTNISLPEDYKKYLEENNGSTTDGKIICFRAEGISEDISLDVLYGIDLKYGLNIVDWCNEYSKNLLNQMIIIGHAMETGIILLVNQDDWNGIYFWDNCLDYKESTEETCIYKISDSFEEFLLTCLESEKIMNKEELIEQLYENRLLKTEENFKLFEDALSEISDYTTEEDIPIICSVFDDETEDDEVMFGLLHFIETFEGEKALLYTAIASVSMQEKAKKWSSIINMRILNNDDTRRLYSNILKKCDVELRNKIYKLLKRIKQEDPEIFKDKVDGIIENGSK